MNDREIKSVRLAKDYRTHTREYLKGTVLTNNGRYWGVPDKLTFHIDDIINCDTGLFEIEYKELKRHIKKILVEGLLKNKLPKLEKYIIGNFDEDDKNDLSNSDIENRIYNKFLKKKEGGIWIMTWKQ